MRLSKYYIISGGFANIFVVIFTFYKKFFVTNIRSDHYYNQPPLQVEIGETPHLTVQYF